MATPASEERITAASRKIVDAVLKLLQNEQGIPLTDAIGGSAALAGAYLLDGSGLDLRGLSPGSSIDSEVVNQAGPKILTLMQQYAANLGLDPDTGWDMAVPPETVSAFDALATAYLLKPIVTDIFEEHSIPPDLRPGLMAITSVQFIFDGRDQLPTDIGKSLALTALIRGSHTVPLTSPALFE